MGVEYRNIHGRKMTRGLRPWLLVPKVLAVAAYFGGIVAAAVSWFRRDDVTPELVAQISALFRFVVVPSLLAAIAFGVTLFFQHPMTFIRLRWLQVKILTIGIAVPLAHIFMSTRLARVRQSLQQGSLDQSAVQQLSWGIVILLAVSTWIIVLGRVKPRLRQNWARDFGRLPQGDVR